MLACPPRASVPRKTVPAELTARAEKNPSTPMPVSRPAFARRQAGVMGPRRNTPFAKVAATRSIIGPAPRCTASWTEVFQRRLLRSLQVALDGDQAKIPVPHSPQKTSPSTTASVFQ